MKKLWSKFWKSSGQTRKQRKYNHNAPLHVKHRQMSASLSKELRVEHVVRSVPLRKGDTVKMIAGSFKGQSGKVVKVSLAKKAAYIEGAEVSKADGSKVLYPVHPSNVRVTKLDLTDKRRAEKINKMKEANK